MLSVLGFLNLKIKTGMGLNKVRFAPGRGQGRSPPLTSGTCTTLQSTNILQQNVKFRSYHNAV